MLHDNRSAWHDTTIRLRPKGGARPIAAVHVKRWAPVPDPHPLDHRRGVVLAGLMAALTAVGALTAITVPFLSPVPFTLQVLAVFLASGLLPPRYAVLAEGVYLLAGVLGLPVFAGGARGLGVLLGPFGGYLWAYPAAAGLGSLAARRSPRRIARAAGLATTLVIIYVGGAVGLMLLGHLALMRAVALGVLPFIPWDAFKALLAYPVLRQLEPLLPKPPTPVWATDNVPS